MADDEWLGQMTNPNDAVRDAILRHLYDLHRRARGPKGVATKIRELQSAMRKLGIGQASVNSNLDYLVQKGWVREDVTPRSYTTPGGMVKQSEVRTYKISDIGIDKLEGASSYRLREHISKVNITNVHGVTIIGDGNVVNTNFTDLSRLLSELETTVLESPDISEEEKLNIAADIGSLQNQLSKPRPDRGIISTLWNGIEKAVTGAAFIELVQKAAGLVSSIV